MLTPSEQRLAERLRKELAALSRVPELRLDFTSPQGARSTILSGPGAPPESVAPVEFVVTEPKDSRLLLFLSDPCGLFEVIATTIQAVLDKLELEKGEQVLLDELSTNWESLEALYEISTDVLRFGYVTTALKRLIDRFVSPQEGLMGALYVTRGGRLEPLASSSSELPGIADWEDLGPFENPIRESRASLLNDPSFPESRAGEIPWGRATSIAAAPLTSRQQTVIGTLIVWRNDRQFEFAAPFLRFLVAITYQASMLLESDRLNRTMRENERLGREIEIASSIQQTLLFGNPPQGMPAIDVASFSAASQRIDGDFHDFVKHNGALDVLIGDVMGKGVAAALLGAAAKNQFLRAIANLAIKSGGAPSPGEIVRRAASRMNDELVSLERFVTLCYARFDPAKGCVDFVDCGHTGIMVHRKLKGETFFLRGDDLPLGVSPDEQPRQDSAPLMPGDTFLLFSDGVTETKNGDEELFGDDRLIDAVETWSSLGPSLLLKQIQKLTDIFKDGRRPTDDFTCIAVRIRRPFETPPLRHAAAEFAADLDSLVDFREWLLSAAATLGESDLARLEIAATEAFVNCILHGSRGLSDAPPGPVHFDAITCDDRVTLEIRHRGAAYDPLAIPPPSFDGSRDSGFGTYIIMRSADELIYSRDEDLNLISMSIMRRLE
jgi:sigma-B regulation protein RsbU (phosphoserine phosphatase)